MSNNTYNEHGTYDFWRQKIGAEIAAEIRKHINNEIEADGSTDWDQFSANGWLQFAATIAEGNQTK